MGARDEQVRGPGKRFPDEQQQQFSRVCGGCRRKAVMTFVASTRSLIVDVRLLLVLFEDESQPIDVQLHLNRAR